MIIIALIGDLGSIKNSFQIGIQLIPLIKIGIIIKFIKIFMPLMTNLYKDSDMDVKEELVCICGYFYCLA